VLRTVDLLPVVDAGAVSTRLRTLLASGEHTARAHQLDRARELFDLAYVLGTAAGATDEAALGLAGLGYVAHFRSEVLAAEDLYTRALETVRGPEPRGLIATRLGFAHYDRGELDAAVVVLTRVLANAPTSALVGRAIGTLGNVARARGESDRAIALYDEASHVLAIAGERRMAATFAMDRAIAELLRRRPQSALVQLEKLTRDEVVRNESQLGSLVNHYTALARLHCGLPAVIAEPSPADPVIVHYLARACRIARTPSRDAMIELEETAPLNAHARVTLQVVDTLCRPGAALGETRALVVARSGSFFRLGPEELVPLAQRPVLARLLIALARARLERPGAPIAGERLAELTWPGERMGAGAMKNRIHVAIATLRKLGLRSALESCGGGYRIDRDVDILIVD